MIVLATARDLRTALRCLANGIAVPLPLAKRIGVIRSSSGGPT